MTLPENVIPRKIAIKTNDPPHIKKLIEILNSEAYTEQGFIKLVEIVDEARKEYHGRNNPDLSQS